MKKILLKIVIICVIIFSVIITILLNQYCEYNGNHPYAFFVGPNLCGTCYICRDGIGYYKDKLCSECAKKYHRCMHCGKKVK